MALAHRLRRLEAFREVATQLMERPQLDRDVFARGAPEPIADIKQPEWTATLYDLLTAYAQQRQRSALSRVRFEKRTVWSLAEARAALERLIGQSADWSRIDQFLIAYRGRAGDGGDRVRVVLRLRARTGARRALPRFIRRRRSRRSTCASGSVRTASRCDAMTRKKTHKEKKSMPSVAKKRVIVHDNDAPAEETAAARGSRRRGRRNCGCSKRCCLPPPSRSTRRRWRAGCRTAST